MSTPTATFAVNLKDGTSAPARAASSAVKTLRASLEQQSKALRGNEAAMKRLQAAGQVDVATYRRLKAAIDSNKSAIAGAQQGLLSLGATAEATDPPTSRWARFLSTAGEAPGPVGAMGKAIGKLREIGPVTVMAIGMTVAVVALAAAAVGAALAMGRLVARFTEFGIASANARRNETLHIEGLTRLRRSSTFAAMGSGELMSSIDRVSSVAAIGRDEVTRYAEQLYRMGVRGTSHAAALEAVSIAAAAGGDEVGRRYIGLAAGAARLGRSVRAVTDDARARFGAVNARMNLSLERQSARLAQSFADLFGGSRVSAALERFLSSIGQIQDLFSQSSSSGRALRQIVEAIFPEMLDSVSELGPMIRRLFQRMVIGGLNATIAFVELRREVRSLWREFAPGFQVAPLLVALVSPIDTLRLVIAGALGILARYGVDAGARLVDGLVLGLRSRIDAVRATVSGLAATVSGSFADALGIRSPSRVFVEHGRDVAAGLVEGVDDGAGAAMGAVTDLVRVPEGGARGALGGSTSISIGDLHVHTAATDARQLAADLRDAVAEAFQGLAMERGAVGA